MELKNSIGQCVRRFLGFRKNRIDMQNLRWRNLEALCLSGFVLLNTSFQVFGRTYPPQKAHYSGKNESGSDFLPLWEATPKPSKIQPQF